MKNFLKILQKKDNLFLILVLAFAFFIRVILLDRFPIGMTHDELNNIFTAKSLFYTGSYAPGTAPAVLPSSMAYSTVTVPEVVVSTLSILIGPFPMSLLMGRIVGALLSVSSVLAVYFIALHLTGRRIFAQISMVLMALNPWSILLGRTMAELNFFVAFFLWGFLVLLKSDGWRIFRALPFYILGFFSYTGGQVSFLVFIIITLIYRYVISSKKRTYRTAYLVFAGVAVVMFAGYVLVATQNQSFKARGRELYLPGLPEISEQVDLDRKLSVPSPLNPFFINKATVYVSGFVNKYINTFSVDYLFLKGEVRAIFSYQNHGTFYLVDLLFIVIGISSLYALNKRSWTLFLAIVVGCSLTAGLSTVENSYSQRVGLIYPFLVMFSGVGIGTVYLAVRSKKFRTALTVIIGLVYFVSFVNLMHIYFFRFPVYASDGWFFQDRVLSTYIHKTEKAHPDTKITVYTFEPKIIFEEYLFYTNSYHKDNALLINGRLNEMDYRWNNVVFTDKCPDKMPDSDQITIADSSFECDKVLALNDPLRITRLRDVHVHYNIYMDRLCNGFIDNRYISQSAYSDFSVEKMTDADFCSNWITKIEE
jgi:hypothetical protein